MRYDIEDSWKKFQTTGKIADYLQYRGAVSAKDVTDDPPQDEPDHGKCGPNGQNTIGSFR